MSLQPWMRAPLCKVVICIGLLLVGLQYMFSGTFNVYRHETLFYIHGNGGSHLGHQISWHNAMRHNSSNSSMAHLLLMNLTANHGVPTVGTSTLHNLADTVNSTDQSAFDVKNATSNQIPICPLLPADLRGPVPISDIEHTMDQLELLFDNLEPGGHYRPTNCRARNRVALIIPYRDRASQLTAFLYHMHPFLQKQQLEYGIIVVEQAGKNIWMFALFFMEMDFFNLK